MRAAASQNAAAGVGSAPSRRCRAARGQLDLAGGVERHQGQDGAGADDRLGRLRVGVEVELGGGGDVARLRESAAHDDDPSGALEQARLAGLGEGEIGQGRHRDHGDPGLLPQAAHQVVDRVPRGLARGRRQLGLAETGGAVEVGGAQGPAPQRPRRAGVHRDVAAAGELGDPEGVGDPGGQRHVAAGNGDPPDLELGRGEGEQDGHGVVDAGVDIEYDCFGWHSGEACRLLREPLRRGLGQRA